MNKAYSLLKDLRDRDPLVRQQAAQSSDLLSALKETDSLSYRENIIEALGLVGTPAVEPLLELFKEPAFDSCLQSFAKAFARVGALAYEPLSKMFEASHLAQRYRIAIILGHMGERSVTDVVLDALHNSPEWYVRSAAAETFIIIPTSAVVDDLTLALQDPIHAVRSSAAKALGRIGDPRAIPALEAACKLRENRGNAFSSDDTVEYYASGAIRIINQWSKKH